jgi:23S rRNA (uracil1939-C5)-methyltransferase
LYIEDEIAGLQVRLYASAAVPPNPRVVPVWLETIARGVAVDSTQTVVDVACEEGLVPLSLAGKAAQVIGIAPDREAMHRAWENARANGITNCVFYTRAPARVLAKLHAKGVRLDAAVVTSRGRPTDAAVFATAAAAGVRRLVCTGHSLGMLGQDVVAARAAGFRPLEVQPVDLLPQTSRIHAVVTFVRD